MEPKNNTKTASVFIVLIVIFSIMLGVCIGIQLPEKKQKNENETIDINSCTVEQLISLSGVGDVKANKIISSRPFKNKIELLDIVGIKTYNNIKQKVRCK